MTNPLKRLPGKELPASLRRLRRSLKSRRFPPDEEHLFEHFLADRTYPRARFGIALGFSAWSFFSLWDALGFPSILAELELIRFGFVAPVFGWLWWTLTRHPERFKAGMQWRLATAPAAAILGLLLMMAVVDAAVPGEAFQRFGPAFTSLYLFLYAFLGLRFIPAAGLGLVSLILVSATGLSSSTETHILGAALSQLAIFNVLGMLVSIRLEIHERTLFRLRQRHRRQVHTARRARAGAQAARDAALLQGARAEAAMRLAREDRARLAIAVDEKERFFSAAFHDLQQPLSIIGLYARLARNKLGPSAPAAIASDLAVIEGAGQEIARMFKGVRETFEIGRTEPTIETVDLAAILEEIERELGERAERKNLAFRLRKTGPGPVPVRSDRMLLKRAISNLVGNAIKYTEQGGVLLGAVAIGDRIRIDVRDSGVGISPEFQERIFDDYFQVRQPGTGRQRGLGLGLAIVRRIERNLPGHCLRFRSRPGEGSRFSLEVPAAPASAGPVAAPATALLPPPDRALEGRYVVVVEDDQDLLDGVMVALRNAGCLVEGAGSVPGARRLFAVRDRCPEALITDWRLDSGETGAAVVSALRERFEWAETVPVLFVTGDLALAPALAGLKGRYQIYRKPIDPDTLLARLRGLMSTGGGDESVCGIDQSPSGASRCARAARTGTQG